MGTSESPQRWWLGPVFWWEVIRASRRGLWHVGRFAFAASVLVYLYLAIGNRTLKQTELNVYSEWMAWVYYAMQRWAVVVLTPLLVCGTFLEENRKQTLPLLLSSMLSAREIVLGKLVGRLLGLLTVLLTGLPMLALLQFLGGIDFQESIWQLAMAVVVMVFLGLNSVCMSARSRSLGAAIAKTYLRCCLHFLYGWVLTLPISGLLAIYTSMSFVMVSLATSLPVAMILSGVAVSQLIAHLPEMSLNSQRTDNRIADTNNAWTDLMQVVWSIKSKLGTPREAWEYRYQPRDTVLMDQEGDVAIRYFRISEVADRPVTWKETWFPLDRRMHFFLTAGSVALGLAIGIFVLSLRATTYEVVEVQPTLRWMAYLVMLLTLGVVLLRASISLTEEAERQTLVLMLPWPWSSSRLLWEKLLGILWRFWVLLMVTAGFILPVLAWSLHPGAFWIVPVFLAQIVFVCCFCLWVSMMCRLRGALTRWVAIGIVFGSLTVGPYLLNVVWEQLPGVAMVGEAIRALLLEDEHWMNERQWKEVWVERITNGLPGISQRWADAARVLRNTVCPWTAWDDIFHQRYSLNINSMQVTFASAMRTSSPWWVHGATVGGLLMASVVLFLWSAWLMGRIRRGRSVLVR